MKFSVAIKRARASARRGQDSAETFDCQVCDEVNKRLDEEHGWGLGPDDCQECPVGRQVLASISKIKHCSCLRDAIAYKGECKHVPACMVTAHESERIIAELILCLEAQGD